MFGSKDTVDLVDIKINPLFHVRHDDEDVSELEKSIQAIGLISPLVINQKNELIAGGRRYRALRNLGIKTAKVSRVKTDELSQEIVHIDENIVRKGLRGSELDFALKRRKELYEMLYPEASRGQYRLKKEMEEQGVETQKSFAEDTAEKLGVTPNTVQKSVRRAKRASEKVYQLKEKKLINAAQMDVLCRLSKQEQDQVLDFVVEADLQKTKRVVEMVEKKGVKAAAKTLSSQPKSKSVMALDQIKKSSSRLNKWVLLAIQGKYEFGKGDMPEIYQECMVLSKNLATFTELLSIRMLPIDEYVKSSKTNTILKRELLANNHSIN